jgi:hypothetical protein
LYEFDFDSTAERIPSSVTPLKSFVRLLLQDKLYRLSEEIEHSPFDNTLLTVDDLEAKRLQDEISNDVLSSIMNDQTHHSKLGKHRRIRKGSRTYPVVPGSD